MALGPGASPPSEGGEAGTLTPETDLGVSVAQSHQGRGCGGQSVRRGGRGPAGSTPRAAAEGEAWLRNGRARRAAGRLRSAESSSGGEARAPAPRERPAAHTLPPPPASAPAGHWEEPKPVRQDSGAADTPSRHTHTRAHTLTAAEKPVSGGGAFRVRALLRVHPAAPARSRQKKPARVPSLPAPGRRGLRLPASPPIPAPDSARLAPTPGSRPQEERSVERASPAPLRPARDEDPSCSRLAVRPLACSFRPL